MPDPASLPVRPANTAAVPGCHSLLLPSTVTVMGWPVEGSADWITALLSTIGAMPSASIAHMA